MNRPCFSKSAWVVFGLFLGASGADAQSPASGEAIDLGNGVTMPFIRVAAGTFKQGSPETETGRVADELQRLVTLAHPFYIGKFPVTFGQFERFVEETRYRTEAETGTSGGFGWDGTKLIQSTQFTWRNPGFPQTGEHPVVLVTYPDAEAFTAWLSRKAGRKFHLPTEAQWEYACRAGTTTAFPVGDSRQEAEKWIWHKGNSGTGTQPVGRAKPNAWGIHDMVGQVWEWCQDLYGPYQPGPVIDPVATQPGPGEKSRRVLRGGSWLKELESCRAATRYRNDPRSRNADNGFRVVTSDEASASPPPRPSTTLQLPEPRLEREDVPVPSTAPIDTRRIERPVQAHSPKRGFSVLGLILGAVIVVVIFKIVRALSRTNLSPAGTVGSLLGGAAMSAHPSGPVSTRIVDDGFWIQSSELPTGALVTCRYTTEGGTQEINLRFEPGAEGHFVYTGSRPHSVSVVVAPGGGPTHLTGGLPPSIQRMRDTNDDDERFRGFPPAY
jgi:formylglycine-generating enzyme required for sulfatase activity